MDIIPELPRKQGVFDADSPPVLTTLSLGAGVQSTALYLLTSAGEMGPKPSVAIVADTTWERQVTYDHIERLQEWQQQHDGVPIRGVQAPRIEMKRVPSYNTTGMYRRRCTMDWKIRPIHSHIRDLLGLSRGQLVRRYVRVLLGISIDEADRMGPSRKYWEIRSFPLVSAQMSREDCQKVCERFGFKDVPSSACVFCPFQSAARWQEVRKTPVDWDRALHAETLIDGTFHRSKLPLAEALALQDDQGDLFSSECSGHCGV